MASKNDYWQLLAVNCAFDLCLSVATAMGNWVTGKLILFAMSLSYGAEKMWLHVGGSSGCW